MSSDILSYLDEDEEPENNELSVTLEGNEESINSLLSDENETSKHSQSTESNYQKNLGYKAATLAFSTGFAATVTDASKAAPYLQQDAQKLIEYAPKVIDAASGFGELGGALATGLGTFYCYSRIER
ncbi:hypothetical protein [Candidatus Nanohalococcus occultus]|uniref:Uncharacterized protein n=1 Tax=Candidatus Nanohalococcus occultus TaxID=2978047 RepID=A0ABY8CCX2_9ARCH|nr:hypothetical protein SVXNc_0036 [Candidatus Nanohaloarchaeota archaeon SVXNc]